MKRFRGFLVTMLGYHILMTGVGGFGVVSNPLIAGTKDIIRIGIVGLLLISVPHKLLYSVFKQFRLIILLSLVLVCAGVSYSWLLGQPASQIIIGTKYTLWPVVLLVGSLILGACKPSFLKYVTVSKIAHILIGVVIVGFVRQGCKILLPELFTVLGYGPVGDFVVGNAPPIRYRTGPGGMMRWQGIFSGPNNYGYFLTAFFSVFVVWCQGLRIKRKKRQSIVRMSIYLLAVILTVSRGAILGVGIQGIVLLRRLAPTYRSSLKWIVGLGGVGLVGLSLWKWGSTVLHIQAWIEGLEAILANPGGYGLGSSGPAVHRNGFSLPENQYLQVAIDLGVWGLVLWCAVWTMIFTKIKKTSLFVGVGPWNESQQLLCALLLGGVGLVVIGMFLHVLEDSMVNYWYLGLLGVVSGSFIMHDRLGSQ